MCVKEDLAGCPGEVRRHSYRAGASSEVMDTPGYGRMVAIQAHVGPCLTDRKILAWPWTDKYAWFSKRQVRMSWRGATLKAFNRVLVCSLVLTPLLLPSPSLSQDITAVGGWSETIDATDLISGAGSDLTDTYESSSGATAVSITHPSPWRVDIKRSDSVWHSNFALYAERTSDGSGSGSISGGQAYQEITTIDAEFFSGDQDRSSIDVRYRLTGMSVEAGPGTYSTTVTYTVVDTP
jgi:hypothetical protein